MNGYIRDLINNEVFWVGSQHQGKVSQQTELFHLLDMSYTAA